MDHGKISVRQLSQLDMIPKGKCIMPQSLYDYGWISCLPIVNIITLPQISNCIALEYTKDQIIDFLINNNDRGLFWKFHETKPNLNSLREVNEFNLYFTREQNLRLRLENNNLFYPQNMQEVINLFIRLGFIIEILDNQRNVLLDLIIHPFPRPENIFKII
ncbi:DUF6042 family protein [Paenibacillus sp. WC2504]|uniref:DUF6042 family protein n=1 Tax=Paenibacillus sp. WC2504 TaxID=3461403 RepID=UPI00404560F5